MNFTKTTPTPLVKTQLLIDDKVSPHLTEKMWSSENSPYIVKVKIVDCKLQY